MNNEERNRKRRVQYHMKKQIEPSTSVEEQYHIYRSDRNYKPGIIALSLFYNDPTIIWPTRLVTAQNILINDPVVDGKEWF